MTIESEQLRIATGRLNLAQVLADSDHLTTTCRCVSPPTTAAAPDPTDAAPLGLELFDPRGTTYLATAPGDLGMARAYVAGDLGRARAPTG